MDTREEINQHASEKLRTARERSGLTVRELAERSGVDFSQISRIESGSGMTVSTAFLLARGLGLKPAYFLQTKRKDSANGNAHSVTKNR